MQFRTGGDSPRPVRVPRRGARAAEPVEFRRRRSKFGWEEARGAPRRGAVPRSWAGRRAGPRARGFASDLRSGCARGERPGVCARGSDDALCQPFNSRGYRSNTTHRRCRAQCAMQAEAGSDGAGPSPRETGIFGEPARKRPIHADSSAALSETPKRRGLPGSSCGRTATAQ